MKVQSLGLIQFSCVGGYPYDKIFEICVLRELGRKVTTLKDLRLCVRNQRTRRTGRKIVFFISILRIAG
jgi:hypothetical protein